MCVVGVGVAVGWGLCVCVCERVEGRSQATSDWFRAYPLHLLLLLYALWQFGAPSVSADNSMRLRIESLSSKWKLRQWFMGLYTYRGQFLALSLSHTHTHWVIAPLYNYCALLSRACGIVSRRRPRSEAQSHHHRLVAVRLRDFYWVGAARLPHYINFAPYQRDNYVERQ